MKNIKLLLLSIILTITFINCTNNSENFKVLDTDEFITQYNNDQSAILLDVRTETEFNNGFIEGALNFDVNASDFEENVKHIDQSKHLYVYCRSGKRSKKAANILSQLGFETIYDLNGGYIAYSGN